MDLQDQVAIVTGGSRGIGSAIVKALAQAGAHVVINYNKHQEEAEVLCRQLLEQERSVLCYGADVRSHTAVEEMIESVLKRFDRIDILINNAGVVADALIPWMSHDEWNLVIDTNLNGTFNGIKAVLPTMIHQRNGVILNISSILGQIGWPGQANYSASKAAINALTRSTATELGRFGIRVNAIAPGLLDTQMSNAARTHIGKQVLQLIPQHAFGTVEDVAALVLFLVSKNAAYITGEVIGVNGGLGNGYPIS